MFKFSRGRIFDFVRTLQGNNNGFDAAQVSSLPVPTTALRQFVGEAVVKNDLKSSQVLVDWSAQCLVKQQQQYIEPPSFFCKENSLFKL